MKKYLSSNIFKYFTVYILSFFSLLTLGCSENDEANIPIDNLGVINTKIILHNGIERTYHVYLPKNFNKENRTPMVIALHGGGGTGLNFESVVSDGTLTAAAESRGMVLVMPEGIEKRWNSGRPEIFDGETSYDDVGFISNIIDTMVNDYNIDAKRIYATGISNGGFMSIRLALELTQKIAAIAPVTAQIPKVHEMKEPILPVSIMIINGTEDPIVPYNGGHVRLVPLGRSRGEVLSTQETIDKFLQFNQCNSQGEITQLPNLVSDDNTEVEIIKYAECTTNTEVTLIKVIGGGHTWPRGTQYLEPDLVGYVSEEINASDMILDFFLDHSRN